MKTRSKIQSVFSLCCCGARSRLAILLLLYQHFEGTQTVLEQQVHGLLVVLYRRTLHEAVKSVL